MSKLCSSAAVYDTMLERRTDLAAQLRTRIWRSRLGEESDRAKELSFEMTLEPGDEQFINSRVLPDDHAVLWRDVRPGARRGGIGQTEG